MTAPAAQAWASRIVGLTYEDPRTLDANPANPKVHPAHQRAALTALLGELGWIAGVILNDRTRRLIDGHERRDDAIANGQPTVPVLHVDLDEAEELLALGTFDPIARMAKVDAAAVDALLGRLGDAPNQPQDERLVRFLAGLKPPTDQAAPSADVDPHARWTLEFPLEGAEAARSALEALKAAVPALEWREDTTV